MKFLYTISIHLYGLIIRLASPFVKKAKLWVSGRKNWSERLQSQLTEKSKPKSEWIWMHCSSLGEFEQGRNLLETIRRDHPKHKILLTFYSPSGYEIRKNYAHADVVAYMPLDTPTSVSRFLDLVKPKLVFFVKYDLWINFLLEMAHRNIPVVLVSVILKRDSSFLKGIFAGLYRQVFQSLAQVYTQDEASAKLLREKAGLEKVEVAGDTRFDRAAVLPAQFTEVAGIREFVGTDFCIVVGSAWRPDQLLIYRAMNELKGLEIKWIIAPHEIHPKEIDKEIQTYPDKMLKYSRIQEDLDPGKKILWIDNVGMLNRLYAYADLAYIGGGFGAGIHNTQEPAAYGVPVAFGPKFEKFKEAVDLTAMGCAISVDSHPPFVDFVTRMYNDTHLLKETREKVAAYIQEQAGATAQILQGLGRDGLI